ncbi:MAG TPA: alpha/beta hydrolase [Candidatus Acidoferrales bacterium]|jgi:acetyl esterase/lipase|nr:alpha/beta hydrolase [Candidatus Acidoferrales bacterium]
MKKLAFGTIAAAFLIAFSAPALVRGQSADPVREFVHVADSYQVTPNVVYRTASNWDAKLDVYEPRNLKSPNTTLIFFHGGGWTNGTKEASTLSLLPYMQMGWTVVNVEYRMTNVALAPAAVEDARCALRWVYRNAAQYNFDTGRIITSGQSAGGHLALITGLLPASAGFDNTCPGDRSGGASSVGPNNTAELKVAAIIDWYGIADVNDVMAGPNRRAWAAAWLGVLPDREELAKQVSPITYVRAGIPPIISVHGDADPVVPYAQKQRFHEALAKAGVAHELVTIPNGKHGGFTDEENLKALAAIRSFLSQHGLPVSATDKAAPLSAGR